MKRWTRSPRPVDMELSTTDIERVPLLDVDGLQVHLDSDRGIVKAVDGVSFNVHDQERVALVGESGAGKSVTARSILRLIPDSSIVHLSGTVTYRGTRISGMATQSLKELRGREIGMIFQDPMTYLNPTKRVSEHLAEAVRRSTGRTAIAGDADACLTAVGLDARWTSRRYPHELSGGMRQRVLIAMVLCCGPRIIVADEPTTALDVTIQAQILRTLLNLTNEYGISLLLITHDLGVVAEVCDRIYVMYAGQIVEMDGYRIVLLESEASVFPWSLEIIAQDRGKEGGDRLYSRLKPGLGAKCSGVSVPRSVRELSRYLRPGPADCRRLGNNSALLAV